VLAKPVSKRLWWLERDPEPAAHVVCMQGQLRCTAWQEVPRRAEQDFRTQEDDRANVGNGIVDNGHEHAGGDPQRLNQASGSRLVTQGEIVADLRIPVRSSRSKKERRSVDAVDRMICGLDARPVQRAGLHRPVPIGGRRPNTRVQFAQLVEVIHGETLSTGIQHGVILVRLHEVPRNAFETAIAAGRTGVKAIVDTLLRWLREAVSTA
jgi:hypothetical protein